MTELWDTGACISVVKPLGNPASGVFQNAWLSVTARSLGGIGRRRRPARHTGVYLGHCAQSRYFML